MACLRTMIVICGCYWLFVLAKSKYDLTMALIVMSATLYDWEAYTSDPFFYSSNLIFPCVIFGLFVAKGYSFGPIEFVIYVASFAVLCTPLAEFFLTKFNGGVFEWIKPYIHFGYFSDEGWSFFQKTKSELEVSNYKLICRVLSIFFTFICMYALWYFIQCTTTNENTKCMFQSFIHMNVVWIGYYVLSIFNQFNVVYLRPDIFALHQSSHEVMKQVSLSS